MHRFQQHYKKQKTTHNETYLLRLRAMVHILVIYTFSKDLKEEKSLLYIYAPM